MPLPDDVWCFLIGGDSTFSVNIDKTLTRTVDHLKKEIRKAPELNARAVDSLTLYRVAIDQSHDKKLRMRELTRLSENLEECTELDEWQRVSTTFGESPPAGKIYVVLVQTPEGESIYCEGVVRMANVAKTSGPLVILVQPPKVSETRRASAAPPPGDVWCFLIGGDSTFSVNIDETLTRTVDHLKKEIRKAPELNARAVDSLTLYRVAIDQSHDKKLRMRELTRLSENLEECRELDEWQRVSTTFGESPPAGKIYVVLVQTPEDVQPPKVSGIRRAKAAPPPGFSVFEDTDAPLAKLCKSFWGQEGKIKDLKRGAPTEFNCSQLDQTGHRLFFFRQYQYMQQRVDAIRNGGDTQGPRDCVVVIGTPGIGKTTFLHYYLALQLARKQVTMLCTDGTLYIFEDENTIFHADASGVILQKKYLAAPCLLNSEASEHPPMKLVHNRKLFILQAASPNPMHTDWTSKRNNVSKFVLNPPDEAEIVTALSYHRGSLERHKIEDAFSTYGCNMRTLYEVLVNNKGDNIREDLRKKVERYTLSEIHSMLITGHEASDHTSHSIIMTMCQNQPQPGEPAYTRSDKVTHVLSGPVVREALFAVHAEKLYSEMTRMISLFQRIPESAPMAGWLWEVYCHGRIYKGGSYTLVQMTGEGDNLIPSQSEIEPINIGRLTPQMLKIGDSSDFTCQTGKFYIPWAKNNRTFDSFFLLERKLIAIQITLSPSHSLKHAGLTKLKKLRPDPSYELYYVFVVPTCKKFKCKVPVSVQDRFHFFLLEMKQDFFMIPSGDVNAAMEGKEKVMEYGKEPSSSSLKRKRESEDEDIEGHANTMSPRRKVAKKDQRGSCKHYGTSDEDGEERSEKVTQTLWHLEQGWQGKERTGYNRPDAGRRSSLDEAEEGAEKKGEQREQK